jgi:hypothetical protein
MNLFDTVQCIDVANVRAEFESNAWCLRILFIATLNLLVVYQIDLAKGSEPVAAAIHCRAIGADVTIKATELIREWKKMIQEAQPAIADKDFYGV